MIYQCLKKVFMNIRDYLKCEKMKKQYMIC